VKARSAAALTIPLLGASSLLAHSLAYRIAIPDPQERATVYEETGHFYLEYAPFFLGVCVAVLVVGVLARALRGGSGVRLSPWPFTLLPFLVFAVQEHSERFIHTGDFPLDVALALTFLVGIALQLPCGIVAYAIARYLLRLADSLGQLLGASEPRLSFRTIALLPPPDSGTALPRLPALALCAAGRAPPGPRS
jgi:hypothetical protein